MIQNIQTLRFVAAALVVLAHGSKISPFGVPPIISNLGGFGVDLFFVISGFIIPYILFKDLSTPASRNSYSFLYLRISRIWPIYVMFTALFLVLAHAVYLDPKLFNNHVLFAYREPQRDLWLALQSLTFTNDPSVQPTVAVGWTLQIEFVFYTLIALCLAFRIKTFIKVFITVLAAVIFATVASIMLPGAKDSILLTLIKNQLMLEFLMGMLLFAAYAKGMMLNRIIALGVLLLGLPAFFTLEYLGITAPLGGRDYHRAVVWGITAMLVVWAALSLEGYMPKSRILGLLGDSSYSLYLVHWILLPWSTLAFERLNLFDSFGLFGYLATYLIASQLAAVAVHVYIEKPLNRLLKSFNRTRPATSYA